MFTTEKLKVVFIREVKNICKFTGGCCCTKATLSVLTVVDKQTCRTYKWTTLDRLILYQ